MKRILAALLMILLLVSCARQEILPVPQPNQDVKPPVVETIPEQLPEEEVPDAQAPVLGPEDAEPVLRPEVEVIPEPDWAEFAGEVYAEVIRQPQFWLSLEETDGMVTRLTIRDGENNWNVEALGHQFSNYEWTSATVEDWLMQENTEDRGSKLTLLAQEATSLTCLQGGDVVELIRNGEVRYVRATALKQGQITPVGRLYDLLDQIAEDALVPLVWSVSADGNLLPKKAAQNLMEQIATNYGAVPNWVSWKPETVRPGNTGVYDRYKGTPEQFCFNMSLQIKLEDLISSDAAYWATGSGLSTPDEEGFCEWNRQVLVLKNEEDRWVPVEWGTGGISVTPEMREDQSRLAQLVELFCLSEGTTHDLIAPYLILELEPEAMGQMPELLEQLTEQEARALCAALGSHLREVEYQKWTLETLRATLGEFGAWLDA